VTRRDATQQTAKADAERRQCWHELRNVVRQIYAEVKANNEYEEGFSISFERTYNMVYRLCKHNPETLFRKLEKEAQNWLEVLRERLVAQLSTTSGECSLLCAPSWGVLRVLC
jgi:hypothetical protein